MLKKNLILCLLIFFYTIVLGHSAIPHGHFDEFFHTEQDHDSQEHSDNNHHHFLFSHSISLHVVIEKKTIFSAHSIKTSPKNTQPILLFYLPALCQLSLCSGSFYFLDYYNSESTTLGWYNSFANRGPPTVS